MQSKIVVENPQIERANESSHGVNPLHTSLISKFELTMISPEPVLTGQEAFFQVQKTTLAYQMLVQRCPSKKISGVESAKSYFEKHLK
jgi:hypothetical protein